ncbi:neutral zinc metallopeptidase [Pusillimonas sp. CC-YST705]|uniref:Neutral zinc metallopeptidase n=1 Tax=Mesopusillimonas faecipullorum TaxID=2755040 RepID=A0ABS8C9X4_9BURK|nr:neutral zinc metallopeptidase [Mesopusillimonas faecipullorum]MCB5362846.1 neutral zinc metallopeptidase [Mesopusillimonas faecipullorum]
MRIGRSRKSENIEDRRAAGPRVGKGKLGIGTLVLVLAALYFGIDPSVVLQLAEAPQQQGAHQTVQTGAPSDPQGEFVARVLGDTEDVWRSVMQSQTNGSYQDATVVLYRGATPTACGTGQSAMGPFYCPADAKIYVDLAFFDELEHQLNAPGEFARAYVLAHEVGHHVQNLLGTLDRVNRERSRLPEVAANRLSVLTELQADCYAGVWAHHAQAQRGILEDGDIERGLAAASAVGDDTLQRRAGGRVVPDSFTHGSSQQRMQWFAQGWQTGRLADCDPFALS